MSEDMDAPRRLVCRRADHKRRCQRLSRCDAWCRRGEPCARLPEDLQMQGDAYRMRQLALFTGPNGLQVELPPGFVALELEPTGGVIPVREARPGVLDFTPQGMRHLTAEQLALWRAWDDHHEAWERTYDGLTKDGGGAIRVPVAGAA